MPPTVDQLARALRDMLDAFAGSRQAIARLSRSKRTVIYRANSLLATWEAYNAGRPEITD